MRRNHVINAENEAVVLFGLRALLLLLVSVISVLTIAGLMGTFFYTSFLLINLVAIRSFTGGYHAQSRVSCFILTNIAVILSNVLIIQLYLSMNTMSLWYAISLLTILLLSPLDDEVRQSTKAEKRRYRRIIIGVAVFQVVFLSLPVGHAFKTALLLSNSIVSILLIIGTIRLKCKKLK